MGIDGQNSQAVPIAGSERCRSSDGHHQEAQLNNPYPSEAVVICEKSYGPWAIYIDAQIDAC